MARPSRTPSTGSRPNAPSPMTPGDEDHAEEHDRHRRSRSAAPAAPRAAATRPGRHDHDLGVAENGGQAGADLLDGVVPEHEVGGEEDAGDPGQARLARGSRPVSAPLVPCQQRQGRQRIRAAEERGRRRRDVGQADEDRGEGDRQRADDGGQHRTFSEGEQEGPHRRERSRGRSRGGSVVPPRRDPRIDCSRMPELLTGTVTFLFTDIEGSTLLGAEPGRCLGSACSIATRTILRGRLRSRMRAARSGRRATRSSSPFRLRPAPSRPPSRDSGARRRALAAGRGDPGADRACTPARQPCRRRRTPASTSTAPAGSRASRTAARSCSRARPERCSTTCPTVSTCATSASTA